MFGFLKPKHKVEGPAEFSGEVVIERPAEQIYALLDWTDPLNAQRALGNEIVPVEGVPGQYQMTMPALPGHVVEIALTGAVPHQSYGFVTETKPMLGRVVSWHEQYSLDAVGEGSCRVTLANRVTFVDRMRADELEHERLMLIAACHNALAKLKIHAEEGVDAVKAVADRLIV